MHINDAVFLEDLCPKFRFRQWRKSIHRFTGKSCIYCGKPSESIDHVIPQSQGGLSTTENCVPACLSCNGDKSDENALYWYRRQKFYDPRRAMAVSYTHLRAHETLNHLVCRLLLEKIFF